MTFKGYKDLLVWQRAMDLAAHCYQLTESFPRSEIYGLSAQLRRSAVSVPSNIAEGNSRRSTKEFLRFLSISLGSMAELETQVRIAERLGYMNPETLDSALQISDEVYRMLHGLRVSLERRSHSSNP